MNSPTPSFDPQHFKQALSRFPTGVSVITTHQLGEPNPAEWGHQFVGLTASSFSSVSLTPPFSGLELGFEITNFAVVSKDFALCDQCLKFECSNRSQYTEGDHIIFVREVEQCGFANGSPLVHQQGGFYSAQKLPE